MTTLQEYFDQLGQAIANDRKRTVGVTAVFQYHITGDDGGDWWIRADNGKGEVGSGQHDSPTTTVTVDRDTFVGIATGEIEGQTAFFEGKLKVEGDPMQAMYLKQVFGQ